MGETVTDCKDEQAHTHASTLLLAVEAYKKQLNVGSEVQLDGLEECAEAQQELEVTRNICNRITAELRHIADLLEEEPTVKMANVTCQVSFSPSQQVQVIEVLQKL
ncbi:hypothetical protein PR048_021595 [Dryococelus australis]|uniref:Uncharacterized protein n=1 Tax=Dryococelus australis TaxID=614101 RepID=A0ABQ9GYL8_9NEOP|nr:hypothetical protein PR048_021595 [Dryococelus australis]